MAYDMLNHLYGGNLIEPRSGTRTLLVGQFLSFDQQAVMSPPASLNGNQSLDTSSFKWLFQSIRLYTETRWGWPTSGLMNWTLANEMKAVHPISVILQQKFHHLVSIEIEIEKASFIFHPLVPKVKSVRFM